MRNMVVALVTLALLIGSGSARAAKAESLTPSSGWYIPPHPRTFAEFLTAGQDLVVIGKVLSAMETQRGYSRVPELMKVPVTEVSLEVDEVLFGSAPGVRIDLTISDTGYALAPGDRILAWANYTPEDNWRLRGRCRKIDGDELHARPHEPVFSGLNGPQMALSFSAVRNDLTLSRHPSTVYNGTRALVLARLRGSSRWTPAGAVYEIDSLACLIGQVESVPRVIRFPALSGCAPGIFPGDSLLVPIPPGFRGVVLPLAHCPTALRVKDCFVPGLGVMLTDIGRSVDSVGLLLHVRSVQRQEE